MAASSPRGSLASAVQVNGGGVIRVGTPIVNIPNGTRIDVAGKVVLNWGVNGIGETLNPLGFNLGASALMVFGGSSSGNIPPAVLNIDQSGNPSQIYGALLATDVSTGTCPTCTVAPAIWVANANGIYVGEGARIVAPNGVGLVGANMNNANSINDFIGNNTWIPVAEGGGGPAYGTSFVSYNSITSKGNVTIAGAINGDFVVNKEAAYIIVAGNNIDVLNTGNLYGKTVELNAGLYGTDDLARVNGISNVTVNRMFDVDAGVYESCCFVGPFPGDLTLSGAGVTGNVTNEGSVSANGTGLGEWITIQAKGNVRSGILGNTDTQVGLFSDQGIYIDSYSNDTSVQLFNAVSGYTTNKTLPFLYINGFAYPSGFRPDVTINAITLGAQPSSITTTGAV